MVGADTTMIDILLAILLALSSPAQPVALERATIVPYATPVPNIYPTTPEPYPAPLDKHAAAAAPHAYRVWFPIAPKG